MADFLQINDVNLTFADYAGLESYFRRQATQSAGLGPSTTKLVKGAMDLVFGFLPEELRQWVDAAFQKDNMYVDSSDLAKLIDQQTNCWDACFRGTFHGECR